MGKADLHIHTTASDGALPPGEVVEKAKELFLKTIAITDHDTIKGYLDAKPEAEKHGIELLSGAEITATWEGREVHTLAYCFDEDDPDIVRLFIRQKKARRDRMRLIVDHLQKQGVDIDMDEVQAEAGLGNIGRPHAASVMVNKKIVASIAEAFIRYLSSDKLGSIKTGYATMEKVIDIIKNAGGVVSLAHPGRLYNEDEVEQLISKGLDGLECIHPSHPFSVQRKFSKKAAEHNLLVTGGSDFHGKGKSDYDPYFGVVTLGEKHVMALKRTASTRKKLNVK